MYTLYKFGGGQVYKKKKNKNPLQKLARSGRKMQKRGGASGSRDYSQDYYTGTSIK